MNLKKSMHGVVALLIISALIISSIPALADETKWEKSTFSSWSDYNIYSGKNELTNISTKLDRANLAYMLVEAFDLQLEGAPQRILDVSESVWYYNYVQIAVSHGLMELENDCFYPTQYVLREEIPAYLSFLPISFPDVDTTEYLDMNEVSSENADAFKEFVEAGYMSNLSTDYIFPTRIATVSDMIVTLDKIFPNVSNGIVKGSVYNGNFILKEKMSYLENATINGDLIITQGAMEDSFVKGNFKISLVNVKVNGNIYVYGGSLYGGFFLTNVKADSINVLTDSPVIFRVEDSDIGEIHNNSELANFYTNVELNIVEDNGHVVIN